MNVPRTFEGLTDPTAVSGSSLGETGAAVRTHRGDTVRLDYAAFQLFIHRYTGADDFCVGSGFANRRDACLQRCWGW